MASAARNVGVQSWSLRRFKDNAQVAQMVRSIGVYRVELCDVHADFTKPAEFARIALESIATAAMRSAVRRMCWSTCFDWAALCSA